MSTTKKRGPMRVAHARTVLSTVTGGLLGPGTLWVSGLLDDAEEAARVVRRANKRAALRAKKLANAKARK